MPPLTPHWAQPSHPEVLTVVRGLNGGYTSKAISNVDLPAGALFAKLVCLSYDLQFRSNSVSFMLDHIPFFASMRYNELTY